MGIGGRSESGSGRQLRALAGRLAGLDRGWRATLLGLTVVAAHALAQVP